MMKPANGKMMASTYPKPMSVALVLLLGVALVPALALGPSWERCDPSKRRRPSIDVLPPCSGVGTSRPSAALARTGYSRLLPPPDPEQR